ncbi:hypothetical protein FFLO_04450 [Filobasidium floriforme]|uniref:4Fe-4S Mo/W bis-MGD-type domain-containing protein n=1 Tax=Filobasidium floriforme TaxID=5210 RepID=A0A8K0NP99_9TREE|nr:hypothetical protein FFLO_04450 [Filobasidium floriforme]
MPDYPKETRDPIANVWGERTPYHGEGQWPVRVDEHIEAPVEKWVQSAYAHSQNGCGADIGVADGKIVGIRGRAVDRVNKGRLGPKGMCSWEYNGHPDRLKTPLIRKQGKLEPASWDEAMELIVNKSKEIIEKLTPHAIAFYTSGQLFLEEYHALAMVGKGGLGTLTMDGNTRLCTATAATAMRESFGCDGQPGSYTDIDVTDCLFIVGHNIAATQTVLWSRMLDRLHGPNPPRCVVIDPRRTPTADLATVHLQPAAGTNLALLNGMQREMFERGYIDEEYVKKHTIGIEQLKRIVEGYTPERVHEITGVTPELLRQAVEVIGTSKTVLATALQGVYQSNQATASACQINNIQLLRGNIGKPGGGIYQMNGQPTAQNNREAGCDGEYPGFRNNNNPRHMEDLAKCWNIEAHKIPSWSDPIHASSMFDLMQGGAIKMCWISGTNPAVSFVNLEKMRAILGMPGLFVVAQDIFETETTQLADVVLPAAMWGEKTGCFTNVDRTVHISHKAIEPPGLAKSDLEIFLDYARRMDFKDKDGKPLIPFNDSKSAFDHWRSTTKGRPCDYTGMSYESLTGGSGIQWPCNAETSPNGTERLYTNGVFMTKPDDSESFGHDLETGTPITPEEYAMLNPDGRAILKSCHYRAPYDGVSKEYPYHLTTGRNHLHFHTRTKTGRSSRLNKADPHPYIQVHPDDAQDLDVKDGDYVEVRSPHGECELPVKIGKIGKGQIFVPFHFGSVVDNCEGGRASTANELTQPTWDRNSKQPIFKTGGVKITKVTGDKVSIPSKQKEAVKQMESPAYYEAQAKDDFEERIRHLEDYMGLWDDCSKEICDVLDMLSKRLKNDFEIASGMLILKDFIVQSIEALKPFSEKYGARDQEAERDTKAIRAALFPDSRTGHGSFELLLDVQGLYTMLGITKGYLTALLPVSKAEQDKEFTEAVKLAQELVQRSLSWAHSQIQVKAVHSLIVPAGPMAGHF